MLLAKPSTDPKSIMKSLKKADISIGDGHIPSAIQISNLKSSLQHDTSENSPHRIQTYPQMVDWFEQFLVTSQQQYDNLG